MFWQRHRVPKGVGCGQAVAGLGQHVGDMRAERAGTWAGCGQDMAGHWRDVNRMIVAGRGRDVGRRGT
jgi:hypothetical protein